jgi:hypothetical protein
MEVAYVLEAEDELARLPPRERAAMLNAVEKLQQSGIMLPYPHSSDVRGTKLRELRPRSGRSPWRAFYRRLGDVLIIGSIGPEADTDRRGFDRAVDAAEQRITRFEQRDSEEE